MNHFSQDSIYQKIKTELNDLPGEIAHKDMIPFRLTASEALKKPVDYRLSAVMLLLYYESGTPHFILTERQDYNGKHSGQISLPGGKVEPEDKGTDFTALRETEEEIGVERNLIHVLGRLTEVYIPVSRFLIHPYIGFLENPPLINHDNREVKSVIHCPLPDLLNEENRVLTRFKTDNGIWMKDIPAFEIQEKIVWGATAIILNEFKFILKRFE